MKTILDMKQKNASTILPVKDLRDMLLSRKERVPENIVFRYRTDRTNIRDVSFSTFAQEVEDLGNFLLVKGFNGKHIAISGANSYEWLLAFFAITTSGNVAVAIDHELSLKDLERSLCHSDSEAIFCSQEKYEKLTTLLHDDHFKLMHFSFESITVRESLFIEKTDLSQLYADVTINPNSLAVIFFTSGTSGQSKAVPLSHFAITSDINANRERYMAPDRSLSVLPFHHAFGLVGGIFMSFNEEKTAFINTQSRDLLRDFLAASPIGIAVVPLYLEFIHKRIMDTIKGKKITVLFRILIRISRLLRAIGHDVRRKLFASIHESLGGCVNEFVCGGAALNTELIKFFDDIGIIVINGYGLTECSPVIAIEELVARKLGSCGKPLSCCNVRIADDGEIFVKGDNVFIGYYKDEKQTQNVVINGEFATGDLGYFDEDGYLFITGRKKNLIILSNGENISPEEIEMYFLKEEGVQEAVVVEKQGQVVALIYPTEEYRSDTHYFQLMYERYNEQVPVSRQIADLEIRKTEFEKNSSMKILRDRIIE